MPRSPKWTNGEVRRGGVCEEGWTEGERILLPLIHNNTTRNLTCVR